MGRQPELRDQEDGDVLNVVHHPRAMQVDETNRVPGGVVDHVVDVEVAMNEHGERGLELGVVGSQLVEQAEEGRDLLLADARVAVAELRVDGEHVFEA